MKIKLIALFVGICMAFASQSPAFAYEMPPAADTEVSDDGENTGESDVTPVGGDSETSEEYNNRPPHYVEQPSRLYSAFDDVIELYVKEHLYEFTREEVLEEFVFDLIAKHPEYYSMFLNTFLGTMDKYSSYHERRSGYMDMQTTAGYGISVQDTGHSVIIRKVLRGTSAESAGLLAGDVIKKVMDIDVSSLPWEITAEVLSTPYLYFGTKAEDGSYPDKNPPITLTVERGGELLSFTMQKGEMVSEEFNYSYLEEESVGYITLTSFVEETLAEDFAALMTEISNAGVKNIILDLRNNGGGSLDLVMRMAEQFVPKGETLCYMRTKSMDKPEPVLSTTEAPVKFDKISVLVNRGTASAAELMASILKHKAGAVLVGETTYGKALGQTVYNFMYGDRITITTYEVLDANGNSYNDKGIVPDLEIENVRCLYTLEKLPYLNHQNYKDILPDTYSEACLALEKRLEILGYLREDAVDGIWDTDTKTAIYVLQMSYLGEGNGELNDDTITLFTDLINQYKDYIYYEDSQFDVALIYHSSFSQAKRLIAEKADLAEQEAMRIEEHNKRLDQVDSLDEL